MATLSVATVARAEVIKPGQPAPPAVVRQLQGTAPVAIGTAVVRPVASSTPTADASTGAAPLSPQAASDTTLVVRASDNLVGVSTNDLVVIYPDTAAVSQAVAGKAAGTKAYPEMGMVVIHTTRFDQLHPLQQDLAKAFPTAKFDLPVRYFELRPK